MKFFLSVAASTLACLSQCQEAGDNYHFASAFGGSSSVTLGSSQNRSGFGLSYGSARDEPRFTGRIAVGQIVYEGYADYTNDYKTPHQPSEALGFLFYARWFPHIAFTKPRPFFDFGWGFQYADRPTIDLPSEINSTPFADLGYSIPMTAEHDLLVSVRFLHISNAGIVRPNRGQDEIYLNLGFTF